MLPLMQDKSCSTTAALPKEEFPDSFTLNGELPNHETTIKTLTKVSAPSGREHELRAAVQKMIQPYADEIRVDALGNLIARKGKAAKNGKRIMLAAHLDEIGIIVSHVDANGFARFSTLGGFAPHCRVGTRVKFLKGAHGIIGLETRR